MEKRKPTVGSLFAGIGGFDLGFEQAGFQTAWQVEIDEINRAVLADRFPRARQFADVRSALPDLWPVDVIVGGFPCQDVSIAGKRKGLAGFGVPTARRRVFLVAGLGAFPPIGFMADTGAVGELPQSAEADGARPHNTLLRGVASASIERSCSDIVLVPNGRGEMVERQRASEDYGLRLGMDEANHAEARAAGNAVCPPVARWIAEKLIPTFGGAQ